MASISVFSSSSAAGEDLGSIRRLLDDAFDGDFTDEDWDHAVGGWHVVITEQQEVIAHAAVVPRTIEVAGRPFHAGYVEAVATAAHERRAGLGSQVMTQATDLIRDRFELGVLSTDRQDFYERLGWERWRGPTYVRHGNDYIRTAAEDGGVMVLRFGPSSTVDLSATIACHARSGDDW